MKCLVTGGLGFIGSNLVDTLIEQGHQVKVVDDLSTGKMSYTNKKARYIIETITNYKRMLEFAEGCDVIFHVAAWARLQRSINDVIGTNNANEVGTVTLLEVARQLGIKRFIFSSSSSVYGEQQSPIMNELMYPNPLHPYALQKWAGERYCQLYTRLFGLQTIILRYFNVYGRRQILEGDYTLVIGKFIQQKKEGKKMTVYGDGTQTRAYTNVKDVVRANLLAMKLKMSDEGETTTLNIGTSKETSVNEIVKMLGGDAEYIIPNPRGKFEEKRKSADYWKAQMTFGWTPEVTIEEGIKELIK